MICNIFISYISEGPKWDKFLHKYLEMWSTRLINWVINNTGHPVHVVRYKDLKQDTVKEVKKMLNFLKVEFDDQELESRLTEDFDTFHRKHTNADNYEHYSLEQREYMKTMLQHTIKMAEARGKQDLLGLHEYLEPF